MLIGSMENNSFCLRIINRALIFKIVYSMMFLLIFKYNVC